MAFVLEFVNVMKGSRGIYAKWIRGKYRLEQGQAEGMITNARESPCAKRNVPIAHYFTNIVFCLLLLIFNNIPIHIKFVINELPP